MSDRKHIAYHEAGHAVMALRLGYEVRNVTIKGGKRVEGRANINKIGGPVSNHIRLDLAGPVAEALVNPTPFKDKIKLGSRGDWRGIRRIARELAMVNRAFNGTAIKPDQIIEVLQEETEALVRRNKQAIARVAAALLEHETLTGDEVKRMVEVLQ